ncbi:MAG: flagellar type III secretion system protein FliR [Alphaproteobacteria bacterium]|nr:flagellar type III secretion system protein FliR [Alphaproteobacteria bacterium]
MAIDWLPEAAYLYLMVFARVGALIMLVPVFGEGFLNTRVRLGIALALALVLYPIVTPELPAQPGGMMAAIGLLLHEMAVGLILGAIARLIGSATQVAGSIIAYQIGLGFAQIADPSQSGVQGAIVGNFLGLLGLVMVLATDLHHLVIAAIYDSYMVYPPQTPLMFADAFELAWQVAAQSFVVGVQLAAPFIIYGLIFNLGLGILSKLMPQLQVFFIAMPASISLGMILLALLVASISAWYLNHFSTEIRILMGQG